METRSEGRRIRGLVKWFDPGKGFGFIVADEGGMDVLLHGNVLRNYGQSSVADGAVIEVLVQDTERGAQAVEIFAIEPPAGPADGGAQPETDPAILALPSLPARVKWFDKGKGFGFVNVFGHAEDVFVHVDVLRKAGLANLQPGEAIAVKCMDGERGRMAVFVAAWDFGTRT